MNFFWWIILVLDPRMVSTTAVELKKLINKIGSYQTVVFNDNSMNQTTFLKNLMTCNPTVIVNSNKPLNLISVNESTQLSIFHYSQQLSIHIIIFSSLAKVSGILNNIVNMSPQKSRPKTLLLTPISNSDQNLKKIFLEAWLLKFLDFSIIQYDTDRNHVFLTYNPFMKKYQKKNLKDVEELFPDKLKNAYGYPLKTRVFDIPPVLVTETINNRIVNVKGFLFSRIEVAAEKLNFKLEYMEDSHNVSEALQKMRENLELNEINVSPLALPLSKIFQKNNILIGYPFELRKLLAIVPIIKVPRIDITINVFMLMLIFCFILIIFFSVTCTLKLNVSYWNIFYIFGLLIGTPIAKPQKKVSRIIYLTIAVLSIIFSNEFFSKLADIKLLFVEQELNTLDDIHQLKIPIYVPNHYKLFNVTEQDQKVVPFIHKIDKIDECVDILIETNNAVCISSSYRAKHYFKSNINPRGRPVMKMADVSFQYQIHGYFYEKASPFAEKIENVFKRLFESHIISQHELLARNKIRIIIPKQLMSKKILLKQTVLIILGVGCVMAIITFVFELTYYHGFYKRLNISVVYKKFF